VVIEPDGRFAGTITASEVLTRIESRAERVRRDTVEEARETAP
jgi:hypothetical protein